MHTLKNWRARRAGGRITVVGTEADERPGKIVGVDVIEPRGGRIIATDKHGTEHELLTA